MLKQLIRTTLISLLLFSPFLAHAGGSNAETPKKMKWEFDGVFGKFDRGSIQRGLLVYKDVCSACHSLKYIAFRNLQEIGYTPEQVKEFAKEYQVEDGPNDDGEMFERAGKPFDYFPSPYANAEEAKVVNNGANPPDLSLITKARVDGANYVYSLLTGYTESPKNLKLQEGLHYNPYFPDGQIAMAEPINMDGLVDYSDGTKSTKAQMSYDVVNFLQWAAEPEMEQRKALGIKIGIFLIIFTILFIIAKKQIWKNLYK